MVTAPVAASGQESEETPEPVRQPVAEVIWQSGKSSQIHASAVRVAEDDLFVCLRPEQSPGANPENLRYQGQEFPLELLASDFKTGLCLLRLARDPGIDKLDMLAVQPAEPGSWPAPGSAVLAFDVKSDVPALGKIAGRDLIHQSKEQPVTLLRVHLFPGTGINRALPLIDSSRKKLIGFLIPESLESPESFHAVPAVFVSKLIRDYETLQKPATGKFGASFDVGSTTPQIISVRDASAANRAGLKKGDVILRIGEWKISRLSDVIEVLRTLTPEVSVSVEVLRELEVLTIEVVPDTVKPGQGP